MQVVLDDETVERLADAAEARGLVIEELIIDLLMHASDHIDELLGPPPEQVENKRT